MFFDYVSWPIITTKYRFLLTYSVYTHSAPFQIDNVQGAFLVFLNFFLNVCLLFLLAFPCPSFSAYVIV